MTETDVRALVDGIVEAWSARDLGRLVSFPAPGVQSEREDAMLNLHDHDSIGLALSVLVLTGLVGSSVAYANGPEIAVAGH